MRQAVKTRTYCYLCPLFMFKSNNPDAEKLSKQETIEKINRLCSYFIGTRNYHNYSQGIKAKDPSAKRYMISMKCE
jgi:tRNA U38,U39,U40 pseudouridine synthase TruA